MRVHLGKMVFLRNRETEAQNGSLSTKPTTRRVAEPAPGPCSDRLHAASSVESSSKPTRLFVTKPCPGLHPQLLMNPLSSAQYSGQTELWAVPPSNPGVICVSVFVFLPRKLISAHLINTGTLLLGSIQFSPRITTSGSLPWLTYFSLPSQSDISGIGE